MARLRDMNDPRLARILKKEYEPVDTQAPVPHQGSMPPPVPLSLETSPFMMSSMPPLAASLDQVTRQFYDRSTSLPYFRLLPVSL